jgi:predicted transcriptional regulator
MITIKFTSVMKPNILGSITVFQNIVKATLEEEIPFEKLDYDLINDVLTFFSFFRSKTQFRYKTLSKISGFNQERFQEIVKLLVDRNFLEVSEKEGNKIFSLTMDKKTNFIEILEKYSREKFSKLEEKYTRLRIPDDARVPPFIGFIIADNIGRTLLVVEHEDGDFIKYLGLDKDDEIDLVSPFLTALNHFSKEINLVNMGNLNVKGENTTMFVFNIHNFLVTFFLNKEISVDHYNNALKDFIVDLLKDNNEKFINSLNSGITTYLKDLEPISRDWLKQLNNSHENGVKKFIFFDSKRAKDLYEKLEDFSEQVSKDETTCKSLRKLKSRLINAIMEKDIMEVKEIAESYEKLTVAS